MKGESDFIVRGLALVTIATLPGAIEYRHFIGSYIGDRSMTETAVNPGVVFAGSLSSLAYLYKRRSDRCEQESDGEFKSGSGPVGEHSDCIGSEREPFLCND